MPAGWLDRFAWRISRAEAEALAARTHDRTAIIDGRRPPAEVADAILAAAGCGNLTADSRLPR